MKKSQLIKILSIVFISSSLFFVISCKKKTNEVDSETQSVVDNSICEQEFMQIQPTTNNLAIQTKGTSAKKLMEGFAITAGCDTLTFLGGDSTYTNLSNPPRWEFNFGTCAAANHDGITRSGKIFVTFKGRPKKDSSTTIIKMQNYKVNNNITYSCDSIVITTRPQTSTTKTFIVDVVNGMCSGASWNIKYKTHKTITINNNSTPFIFADDYTSINGTTEGTSRTGKNFSVVVNNTTKYNNCKYIVSGSMELTPEGLSTRTVDYGNGTCDDDATFNVNGQTIAFKLK